MFVETRKNAKFSTKLSRTLKRPLVPIWLQTQRTKTWQAYQERRLSALEPRITHSFCIGLPKTGTHSIAKMLQCRAKHEPETHIPLFLCRNYLAGKIDIEEQVKVLKARDAMLWLEMESNWVLGLVIEPLALAFPQAKYVLTVREPLSWLESQINEEIETGKIEPFASAHNYMFGSEKHTKHDRILADYGHYSVAGYLSYWASQHRRILDSIPPQQLMIVYTKEITDRAEAINDFVGSKGINRAKTRSYARHNKTEKVTDLLDTNYINEQVELFTSEIWQEIAQLTSS